MKQQLIALALSTALLAGSAAAIAPEEAFPAVNTVICYSANYIVSKTERRPECACFGSVVCNRHRDNASS